MKQTEIQQSLDGLSTAIDHLLSERNALRQALVTTLHRFAQVGPDDEQSQRLRAEAQTVLDRTGPKE